MNTVRCTFTLTPIEGESDQYTVVLLVDDEVKKEATFSGDLSPTSRLMSVISAIAINDCNIENLKDVGAQLWSGLLSGDIRQQFDELRKGNDPQLTSYLIYLDVPGQLRRIPWETLYDEHNIGFLCSDDRYSIIRISGAITVAPPKRNNDGRLRVLVAIPEGARLNVPTELNNLRIAFDALGSAISFDILEGRVTADRIAESIQQNQIDIFHFVGHGDEDEETGEARIRLNGDDGENWIDGETFATLLGNSGIRLVVLNCCLGAVASAINSVSGLGLYLLRKNVPGIVAMQYEIPDDQSLRFAQHFYKELLQGKLAGRPWMAVNQARNAIRRNQKDSTVRGFITPVLYGAPEWGCLFDLESADPAPVIKKDISHAGRTLHLPEMLINAFRENRCVPMIGSGVLRADVRRGGAPVLGPLDLAKTLASESNYPCPEELDLGERAGTWLEVELLQRVCGFYESKNRRFQLIRRLQDHMIDQEAPALLQNIAKWRVPGILYCLIDGHMEKALTNQQRKPAVANSVREDEVPIPSKDELLLVNIRGTWSSQDSLVVTEQDHDDLSHQLLHMAPYLQDLLTAEIGRSLLLVGIDPRDRFTRQVCRNLMVPGVKNTRGPLFFVCDSHTEVDDAYWEQFDVFWVETDLQTLAEELASISGAD